MAVGEAQRTRWSPLAENAKNLKLPVEYEPKGAQSCFKCSDTVLRPGGLYYAEKFSRAQPNERQGAANSTESTTLMIK